MDATPDVLGQLRGMASTAREQGELFERFVSAYLRQDPYYKELFSDVWLWRDWPGRGKEVDSGIDLVAKERRTGGLWAIQVKFQEAPLNLSDIATFLAQSGRKEFSHRMLITTSFLGPKAEAVLQGQEKPVVVITWADIINSSIEWSKFTWDNPDNIPALAKKTLRPYQREAISSTINGFKEGARGKIIMPPGSGKTFVALKIAESLAGPGGYVLFAAPSIALVEQTLRAWLADAELPLRVFAVTSDYTVGREEKSLERTSVLTIPPTTNAAELAVKAATPDPKQLTVVVSTYHSLDVIADAQKLGLPKFDLIIADEAHRTTGILQDEASYFQKIHDDTVVAGEKRLYMTATPKIFVPRLKERLEDLDYSCFSMDDPEIYGEEFFRYGFGQAVDDNYLSDYRVVVFTVSEREIQDKLFRFLSSEYTPEVEEAAKIIGVWSAFNGRLHDGKIPPLQRGVVFAGRIADSKKFAEQFAETAKAYSEALDEETALQKFDVRHIDGTMTATERKAYLDWLRAEPEPGEARILSNAKVLTEGIDVPALDAVVFLKPRRSVVEIVQAVGRVMRKSGDKNYGYVILPVIVDPDKDASQQLDNSEEFRVVWEVLGALRSLDDRFDAEVRDLWLRKTRGKKGSPPDTTFEGGDIIIVDGEGQTSLDFDDELFTAIMAKLVERVGDRAYLESWANDVAAATTRILRHISLALEDNSDYGRKAKRKIREFAAALSQVVSPGIEFSDALNMLAQHIVTKPIFDAIFGEYEFLKSNPVARSLDRVASIFEEFIRKETRALDNFYRLIAIRAKGMDKERERQDFLRLLYDTFFKVAFPRTAEQLGIVYTPVDVVDFLAKSAESVLQDEFGLSLADENVVILEPFAGTGTFVSRLMHLIPPESLKRKYRNNEIWANEIMLLPYYIALTNIESTYFEITGRHESFPGLLLADSFYLCEEGRDTQVPFFPEQYGDLMRRQNEAQINVIISNPPWFAWQESENLGIKQAEYKNLEQRIRETYAAHSTAKSKISLYDSYIKAIRMSTDRIQDKGVILFVTNNGFLDSKAADGLRKCLVDEFAKIYVVNLRGNARLSGEAWRKEGGKIFGQGSRAGVALLILVKDAAKSGPATILYHDIGEYLSTEEKLAWLREFNDIGGIPWKTIEPNRYYDWINQRSGEFESHPAIGSKESMQEGVIFALYSGGLKTNRDAWAYNFSKTNLENNMKKMIGEFNDHAKMVKMGLITKENINSTIEDNPKKISWTRELKKTLLRGHEASFNRDGFTALSIYRPFIKQWVYFSRIFANMIYRLPKLFPETGLENMAISVQAPNKNKPFSALMVDHIPDFHLVGDAQVFPLYTYEPINSGVLEDEEQEIITAPSGSTYIRRPNITNWALKEYRKRYGLEVSAADIFYYCYGLLHSKDFRDRYENDLQKVLPHIPFVATAEDFWAFSEAGRELANLHLNYESVECWPVAIDIDGNPDDPSIYRISKMKFGDAPSKRGGDKTTIIYNDRITLRNIPLKAYGYIVNGASAIEWIMGRYQVTVHKKSGIKNDPNLWLEEQGDPMYILNLLRKIITVSMKTLEVLEGLPELIIAK